MFQFLTGGRNAIRFAFSPSIVWIFGRVGRSPELSNPELEILGSLETRVRVLDNLFHISNPTILSDLLCENSRNRL